MTINRLKTHIWIQAQLLFCQKQNLPVYILHKGDPDAGAVIVKINIMDGRCRVYTPINNLTGGLAWQSISQNEKPIIESEADQYIAKQIEFDPDLWVMEVDDSRGQFELEGKQLQ